MHEYLDLCMRCGNRFDPSQVCDTCRAVNWPALLRELDASERAWNTRVVRFPREDYVPWLPFPREQFIALLTDAVEAAPARVDAGDLVPPVFLDVGCGIGTKMRLARALFSLEVAGIEIMPELAAEARSHGDRVWLGDAFGYGSYDDYDIVYLNRPSTLMAELEQVVMNGMRSGAVLMLVNGLGCPELNDWTLVAKEWGTPAQGAWIKP